MASGPITSWQIDRETMETVIDFIFRGSKITADGKEFAFNPWIGKIPYRRKWKPTPVFLPRESMVRGAWQATVHGVT